MSGIVETALRHGQLRGPQLAMAGHNRQKACNLFGPLEPSGTHFHHYGWAEGSGTHSQSAQKGFQFRGNKKISLFKRARIYHLAASSRRSSAQKPLYRHCASLNLGGHKTAGLLPGNRSFGPTNRVL